MTAVVETPTGLVAHPRKRRGAELGLLLLALCVSVGAYAIIQVTMLGQLDRNVVIYGSGFALLALAAHVVVRIRAPFADPVLLPAVVLLNGLGLALIHRLDLADVAAAQAAGNGPPHLDAPMQLTWTALGVVLFGFVLFALRDHRWLQRITYTSGLIGVVLLLLPLIPHLGVDILGARIWIRVGPLSFQPGEVAKVAMIIFFAGYLVVKRDALALAGRRFLGLDLPRTRDLGPLLVGWLFSLGVLVFEHDLGTSLMFFGAFVVLLYVSTERAGWLVLGAVLFAGGTAFGYYAFGYVRNRFDAWLDPFAHPDGAYQIIQSLYGLAYGGILGTGLGQGRPNLVPLAKSDFIAATVGEELGTTGLMAVIVIYALIVERALRTSVLCRDGFGKLLAVGFGTMLALQVFVVLGGVTKLIPLTGLTTPFMSQGGSSLVANWVIIALLLRVSNFARRPPPPPVSPELRGDTGVDDPSRFPATSQDAPTGALRLPGASS